MNDIIVSMKGSTNRTTKSNNDNRLLLGSIAAVVDAASMNSVNITAIACSVLGKVAFVIDKRIRSSVSIAITAATAAGFVLA